MERTGDETPTAISRFRRSCLGPRGELLAILAMVWAVLVLYAFAPAPLRILGHELRKCEIAEYFAGHETSTLRAEPEALRARSGGAASPSSAETPPPRPLDETPQRILILGDSMIDGLLPRLADYAAENGHSVYAVIWYGSRTIDWGRGARLSEMLTAYRPTFVIVVLGSSELYARNVDKRASAVERMLATIAPRKLVWIGPPNWTTDTGINALLEQEVGRERYFRSSDLTFERKKDHIHPTLASSERWMDAVARWIVDESGVPIRLAVPTKTGAPRPSARVFPPPT